MLSGLHEQLSLAMNFQGPAAGAVKPHEKIELMSRVVEPLGVPQERGHQEPRLQVVLVATHQEVQLSFGFEPVSFQIVFQGFFKEPSAGFSGRPQLAADRPRPSNPADTLQAIPRKTQLIIRSPGANKSVQNQVPRRTAFNRAAAATATAKAAQFPSRANCGNPGHK